MVVEFTVIDNLRILTNDRISIFGRTGSGKTYFAKNWLLPHYDRYVFWDIKHENVDMEHDIVITNPTDLEKNIDKYNKILYQPKSPTQKDFNNICEVIFNSENNTLYVDEAAMISTPTTISYWHKILVTQGRSYGVGIIDVSQRPRDIHNTLISESEHLFVFSLSLETDITKVRQQIGERAANEIYYLPEHHVLYYNVKENKSYIFKPVKELKRTEGEVHIPRLEVYIPRMRDYVKLTS